MISESSPFRAHWWQGMIFLLAALPLFAADKVDFNRDIRPILSDKCYRCHGPDEEERKGGKRGARLRLDTPEGSKMDLGGRQAVVPGHPEKSDLLKRVATSDEDEVMPPPSMGKKVSKAEMALLEQWIKQGANYSRHWSYEKPVRPQLPSVKKKNWPKNAIDYFVLRRLDDEKLKPSAEADRATLIRRAALDLTGLPPTIEEVRRFVGDKSKDAYERMVDGLLAKEAYGEHWARFWLDQARYADSAGYADDPGRTIWGYRDYVIRALNANKGFDQFTIEQFAGDLLPEPSEEQLIATAFHRNTMTNNEGGTSDEEFRNVAVVDRVNTTMSVWMGTTMACAQCHSHKYDPITQEEYFKVFAILNNTEDADRSDESPYHTVWTAEQKARRAELQADIARIEKIVGTMTPELAAARAEWEKNFPREVSWSPLKISEVKTKSGASAVLSEGEARVEKKEKTDVYTVEIALGEKRRLGALQLEVLPDGDKGAGHGGGNFVVSRIVATNNGNAISFTSALADYSQEKFEAQSIIDNKDTKRKGWAVGGKTGEAHQLMLLPNSPVEAEGVLTLTIEQLSEYDFHTLARFRFVASSDARAAETLRTPKDIFAILKKDERSDEERAKLAKYYLAIAPDLEKARQQLAAVKKTFDDIKPVTTVPILRELVSDKRRKTQIQLRGNFMNLGKEVSEGVPASLHPLKGKNQDRLALAKWLVDRDNPLTARVIVNRYWETIFGLGLVRTSEDFGLQGEVPSHPELLDWLAVEFIESGWDVKHMLKLMVSSAAYRQSSRVSPEMLARDPENRLLARGPRVRLGAETIRDQALFVAGLLSPKMYGPPVKPPQPKLGLSAAFGSATDWETSSGEDRYRRALYTTWRRSNPYPSMATFDAPNREVCTVRRERSNTPLQALVTLNDPVYIEAAQALARRLEGKTAEEKLAHAFELCLSRRPGKTEAAKLLELHAKTRARFEYDPVKASAMATKPIGDLPAGADMYDLAAWSVVANVILNLDETLMKR